MHTLALAAVLWALAPGDSTLPHPKIHARLLEHLERTGEPVTAWVFFVDKATDDTAAALAALARTYDSRATARRRLRRTAPGLFDTRDLPLASAYVRAVEKTGPRIRVYSRWLNAVSVEADRTALAHLARLDCVARLEPVARTTTAERSTPDDDCPPLQLGFYGAAGPQTTQVRLDVLHGQGYTGRGVVIGILDTGFRRTHAAYNHPDHPLLVVAEHDFLNDDANAAPEPGDLPEQHHHGTFILGVVAAYDPGTIVGAAYDAAVILAKVEDIDGEYATEEDFFVAGLEFIEANGGDVATSSLVASGLYGPDDLDGLTAVMTIGLNTATDNGLHCFQGAGNSGHDTDPATNHLVVPADALGTVTVGAVNGAGTIASFSSDGPTVDGRLKPEVLARGVQTITTSPSEDDELVAVSGTSLSTPLAASVAACLVQAHPEWTVSQMRSALFQTASYYVENGTTDPLFVHGYGIIDAAAAAAVAPSPADLDGDFHVTVSDLVQLVLAWGPCPGCPEDLNGSGVVDVEDLVLLIIDWG